MYKVAIVNLIATFIGVGTILMASVATSQTDARTLPAVTDTRNPGPSELASLPAAGTSATQAPNAGKLQPIQIGVAESTAITHAWLIWLNSPGCNQRELPFGFYTPESQLRTKVRAGDLTAMGSLALKLIWDGDHDGRAEAKQLLHEAILRGSTCALATHNLYLLRAEQGTRTVQRDPHGKNWAKYTLPIPKTQQEKEHNIMKAYAWDLVYEMRTGLPNPLGKASTNFAARYHDMGFHPTASDYQYACTRANRLYQTLQLEREAKGLGPFDDTPPPMHLPVIAEVEVLIESIRKAIIKRNPAYKSLGESGISQINRDESLVETGSHCAHWPVPKPRWTLAELQSLQSDGKIKPNLVWLHVTKSTQSMERNP